MPIINVKLVAGAFNSERKRDLLPKLTDAVEAVYPGLRDVTFITIEEVAEGDWGIGGQAITADKVAAHARQASNTRCIVWHQAETAGMPPLAAKPAAAPLAGFCGDHPPLRA